MMNSWRDMQDLLVGRDRHRRATSITRSTSSGERDLLVLDRDHAAGVEAADVAAGEPGVNLADLAVGHQLDLLDDHAGSRPRVASMFTTTPRLRPLDGLRAQADDVESAVRASPRRPRR